MVLFHQPYASCNRYDWSYSALATEIIVNHKCVTLGLANMISGLYGLATGCCGSLGHLVKHVSRV